MPPPSESSESKMKENNNNNNLFTDISLGLIITLGGSPSPAQQDFDLRRFGRSTPTFLKQNSVHKTKQSVYVGRAACVVPKQVY